jgi:hypothetical protein
MHVGLMMDELQKFTSFLLLLHILAYRQAIVGSKLPRSNLFFFHLLWSQSCRANIASLYLKVYPAELEAATRMKENRTAMIPPAEVTGGTEVLIRAIGKVLRLDKHSANGKRLVGVAAVTERYEIVRNKPAIE